MNYLYGASGHAKVILDNVKSHKNINIDGIFDDDESINQFLDLSFLGKYDKDKITSDSKLLVSIGNNSIRKEIVQNLSHDFFNAIHKKSIIAEVNKIGVGNAIMPNAVINTNSIIGNHCIINTGSVIEHDCILEDYVHISPNATITGGVTILEGTHIGAGAVVIPNIKIGKWVTIGAGAVIIENVPDYAVVVGNPAQIIKYNSK